MRIAITEAHALAHAAMRTVGYDDAEATEIADHLVDCELRGLSFGGLARALTVVERIRATPAPRQPIRIIRETPCSATIDGGDQVGYLVAARATEIAISKSAAHGIAVVGAHNTWYTGMFSWYLERVTHAGLAGFAAGSGLQIVAPHGGSEGRFGTNPVAFGFPASESPVIWDVGTAAVMHGDVKLASRLGAELAPGMAFDRHGTPTRDPLTALQGAFTVWGGHKGSGLALVAQVLGMMCGAAEAPDGISDCGFFLLVIDPGLLTPTQDFQKRVTRYADAVRATRPVDPVRPVRVPFDRSAHAREQARSRGTIEVADEIVTVLRGLTDDHGAGGFADDAEARR